MAFKKLYQKLLTAKKQNPAALSEESLSLIHDLSVPDKWFEAMALCEASTDAGKLDENILNLRTAMFFHGRELYSVTGLNDEDYSEWFVQLVDFNKKLAATGVAESWVELGSLYYNARFPHRDISKSEGYMLKGVELDVPLALSLYGYHLYQGTGVAKSDKEKGMELMLRAKEKNFERADVYLFLSEYGSDTAPEAYAQKIEDYNATAQTDNQLWSLLGDVYHDKLNDLNKALEAYRKGIEVNDDPYCKYKMATFVLNGDIDGDKDEALLMVENAYQWNMAFAADLLGQFYYQNEDYRNVEKAIEWYKKAIAFYDSHSMLNLAYIYLYNNEYENIAEGLRYIDLAIENGSVRALCEKAYFLLDVKEEYRNVPLAKELLEKAYEAGDGYAAYRLGLGYQNAEFSEQPDYETAFKYYLAGAERNHLFATELLGRYYRIGVTGEPDPEKAIEYYSKAIERGSNYARVELALCYEEGFGVERDENKAFELLEIAAGEDYTYAYTKLGYYYLNGIVVESDVEKSFEYFSKAAENGNPDAMYNLGRMYKYSIGRPENPELALKYFEQAAESGDVDANIEMGIAYEIEYGGLEFDGEKAIKYMTYAAEKEHPYAQYKLGTYYYYGMVETDIDKGLEYLNYAYENGSPYAAAVLGNHFLYSMDANTDCNNAFQYYQYAADKDYITEGIGLCYLYGIGVEHNVSEAFKYFSIAADRGYVAAKYRLGICYKYELGTTKNLSEAYKWLSQAAEEDNRGAKYELAMMLLDGEGVAMNLEKGVEWLRKAADDEQNDAQLELGNCYLIGRGVDEDEVQAMYWYQKAAENGNEQAQKLIGKRDKSRR